VADSIGFEVAGERLVALRFEEFPERLRARLKGALDNIERRLEAAVRAAEPERTGRLHSETGGQVYEHPDRIAAVVGVRVPSAEEAGKAAALEYGAHGSFAVRAHTATLSHLFARAIAPIQVQVAAHTRRANITERRYLRSPIDAIRSEALDELRQAVSQAAGEA
jgi:hypothetical protein